MMFVHVNSPRLDPSKPRLAPRHSIFASRAKREVARDLRRFMDDEKYRSSFEKPHMTGLDDTENNNNSKSKWWYTFIMKCNDNSALDGYEKYFEIYSEFAKNLIAYLTLQKYGQKGVQLADNNVNKVNVFLEERMWLHVQKNNYEQGARYVALLNSTHSTVVVQAAKFLQSLESDIDKVEKDWLDEIQVVGNAFWRPEDSNDLRECALFCATATKIHSRIVENYIRSQMELRSRKSYSTNFIQNILINEWANNHKREQTSVFGETYFTNVKRKFAWESDDYSRFNFALAAHIAISDHPIVIQDGLVLLKLIKEGPLSAKMEREFLKILFGLQKSVIFH